MCSLTMMCILQSINVNVKSWIRFVHMWAGRLTFVNPVISSDLHLSIYIWEICIWCLTTCENCKNRVSLSRSVFFCAVEEPILYSQLELVWVFNSLSSLLSYLWVDQPKRKEALFKGFLFHIPKITLLMPFGKKGRL
jgi:hypothetical protein